MCLKQDEMHIIVPCPSHAVGNYTLHDFSLHLHVTACTFSHKGLQCERKVGRRKFILFTKLHGDCILMH